MVVLNRAEFYGCWWVYMDVRNGCKVDEYDMTTAWMRYEANPEDDEFAALPDVYARLIKKK